MANQQPFDNSFTSLLNDRKRRRKTDSQATIDRPIPANVAHKLETYRQAHNIVESRVHDLEKLARPYQEFEKKTRRGIQLMQQVRTEVTSARKEALNAIDEGLDEARNEYASHLRRLATGCVEMSTNLLARVLIKRLEDGDEIKGEYVGLLRELLPQSDQIKRSQQFEEQAGVLLSPPSDEEGAVPQQKEEAAPPTAVSQTLLAGSEEVSEVPEKHRSEENADNNGDTRLPPAPRRSDRASKPTERQKDFVTWKEAKAFKRRRSSNG